MRFFRDNDGDIVAIEGSKAVVWSGPELGWTGSDELAQYRLSNERTLEISAEAADRWLSAVGTPKPSF